MKKRYPLSPKVIGQIILSKFLKRSPESYLKYIREVFCHSGRSQCHSEAQPKNFKLHKLLFNDFQQGKDKVLMTHKLPKAKTVKRMNSLSSNVLATIKKNGDGFNIYYRHKQMTVTYEVNQRYLQKFYKKNKVSDNRKKEIEDMLRKLRLITTRNIITHSIIMTLLNYQNKYFETDNPFDLKPMDQRILKELIDKNPSSIIIDHSRISRLIDKRTVIMPSKDEVSLKYLLSNKKKLYKRYIQKILDQEKAALKKGKIKSPYYDYEIRDKLKKIKIQISARYVSILRAELGLPISSKRKMSQFPGSYFRFSPPLPFTKATLDKNAPEKSGVYLLCIKIKKIEYPKGKAHIFYIGSSQNIKKRLKNHLSQNGKNGYIKDKLSQFPCIFRYVNLSTHWKAKEKALYRLFMDTYGEKPESNSLSP